MKFKGKIDRFDPGGNPFLAAVGFKGFFAFFGLVGLMEWWDGLCGWE
jgi:hypothetical protein